MEFPETLPGDFSPKLYGLPYLRAVRFFCDPEVHRICLADWQAASASRCARTAYADKAWARAERSALERLRQRRLWGYGRPESAARPFRRIEPHEWEGKPKRITNGSLNVGGTLYWQVHIHDSEGIPFEVALMAFSPPGLADELGVLPNYVPRWGELRRSLEAGLIVALAAGRLLARGQPLTLLPKPMPFYSGAPNVGFAFDDDGSRAAEYAADHLARHIADQWTYRPGAEVDLSPGWWQPESFESHAGRLVADGRLFGSLRVRLLTPPTVMPSAGNDESRMGRGGRPVKYDWENIMIRLGVKLCDEGFPAQGEMAQLEKWVAAQFPEDNCPAESLIRAKVSKAISVYRSLVNEGR